MTEVFYVPKPPDTADMIHTSRKCAGQNVQSISLEETASWMSTCNNCAVDLELNND